MESRERNEVRRAMDALKSPLEAYVSQELGVGTVQCLMADKTGHQRAADVQKLVGVVIEHWHDVFARRLPPIVKTYFHELRAIRNKWAHEELFSPAEAQRALSTIHLVASAIGVDLKFFAPNGQSPSVRELRSQNRGPRTQRSVMRELFARYPGDTERIIREYAAAESRGEVPRKRNASGLTPEGYARALLADGEKKGWLAGDD